LAFPSIVPVEATLRREILKINGMIGEEVGFRLPDGRVFAKSLP
jgi:hypothetical protein